VVSGQWSVVSCQWSVGSCQLSVGSCQLSVGSWQLAVGSWQLGVGSWQLAVGSWAWAVGSGQWCGWGRFSPSGALRVCECWSCSRWGSFDAEVESRFGGNFLKNRLYGGGRAGMPGLRVWGCGAGMTRGAKVVLWHQTAFVPVAKRSVFRGWGG
jgi:hypothetical protein